MDTTTDSENSPFRMGPDLMNTDNPAVDKPSSSDQSRKRPAPSPDHTIQRRTRGTYTPVACDGCKKRKLKCIPVENKASCERCLSNGLSCQYTQAHDTSQVSKNKSESSRQYHAVKAELAQLRHDFAELSEFVKTLSTRLGSSHPSPQDAAAEKPAPKQPQFVGPTRSAYGFILGHNSLTNMGIPPVEDPGSSRSQSPAPESRYRSQHDPDFWKHCTIEEITRLLGVFKEEVEAIYPFVVADDLIAQVPDVLDAIQKEEAGLPFQKPDKQSRQLEYRDIEIMKIAVCLGMNLEAKCKTELSETTLRPIENNASKIAGPEVDLKQVQLLAVMSTYYFHSDEELLAWRTIGVAARAALEMGLHRKRSLDDMFHDNATRQLAIRVFWCIYLLDRRFSFGTSLSFALQENDIDPDLPKPGPEYSYLNCLIGYGMLCSRLWSAIPPFRSPSSPIAKDTVAFLDRNTLDWMDTIPPHLKLQHPRQRPTPQPSSLHRLRAMLYLRGNHTRILIYRHHLFSAARIAADLLSANLVVDVAKDTVEVLVHLNSTTDIYSRQQSTFNYFLVGALSAIFLAVCHAPKIFRESCKKNFTEAVELIRGFSGQSSASRRLWNSIRGLLPRLKRLDLQGSEQGRSMDVASDRRKMMENMNASAVIPYASENTEMPSLTDENGPESIPTTSAPYDGNFEAPMPDFTQMGDNLMDLFDIFGQWEQLPGGTENSQNLNLIGQDFNDTANWEGGSAMLFPGFV
ncbi:hypothetical protein PT974_08289 [Cladobotryum mycophilum]|uniref:Zn(2)-C6 fungal-type domain-containing protein n=1 Tax=Cladobotryum mycophilum TaxID=491253 RepID=A0ABR0SCZ7_9HYPO